MTPRNPRRRAIDAYYAQPQICQFSTIEAHVITDNIPGFVIATTSIYLLATFHHSTESLDDILDLSRQPCRMTDRPDVVHIWLAAGDLRSAPPLFLLLPDSVGFISYERFSRPGRRLIPLSKFKLFPH